MKRAQNPFSRLKIALVADGLTGCCLRRECRIWDVTPRNYRFVFRFWKPDLLLVESAWNGWRNAWKYRIASYPDHPERSNAKLAKVAAAAREQGIPSVFWNKEDGVHFERFIGSAGLFDAILTVDENCIPAYKQRVRAGVSVEGLMFAVQPEIHFPATRAARIPKGSFVGSYSRHIHDRRRFWQDMLFCNAGIVGLTVFDRNSSRRSPDYRFPVLPGVEIRPAVPHPRTAGIYRDHLFSLNVNTVENSPTMFSRRLIEIMACGGLAITSPALAVDTHFAGLCHVVRDAGGAAELFSRLSRGLSREDREMARAASETVLAKHTWRHRLAMICETAGIA